MAVPDGVTAGIYMYAWLNPLGHPALGRNLLLVMLIEFIVVHSAGFLGGVAYSDKPKADRMKGLLFFAVIYFLFVAGFAAGFQAWWPIFWFVWLILSKMIVVITQDDAPARAESLQNGWAFAAGAYLIAVMLTTILPVPRLGIDLAAKAAWDLPGSGLWISQPQRVIAAGFLYFGATALFKFGAALRTRESSAEVSPANAAP